MAESVEKRLARLEEDAQRGADLAGRKPVNIDSPEFAAFLIQSLRIEPDEAEWRVMKIVAGLHNGNLKLLTDDELIAVERFHKVEIGKA